MSKRNYTTSDTHKLLTIGQAAKYLGVHTDTLRLWCNEQNFPHVRFSKRGHRYFDKKVIADFIKKRSS